MKQLGLFLKTTTLGGLFMLLPVVLTLLLISKAVGIIRDTATKIISLITHQVPDAVHFPIVLAVFLKPVNDEDFLREIQAAAVDGTHSE
jgi:uncharacterized membrane protein